MTGEKAKPIMMASKLPLDALGKVGVQTQHVWCSVVSQSVWVLCLSPQIWNLSDINKDGQLDEHGFAVVRLPPSSLSLLQPIPAPFPPAGHATHNPLSGRGDSSCHTAVLPPPCW